MARSPTPEITHAGFYDSFWTRIAEHARRDGAEGSYVGGPLVHEVPP